MDMQAVSSSNIESIGYDNTEKKMAVKFIGGATYTYTPVTQKEFSDFLKSESKGSYFHKNFKANQNIKVSKENSDK